MAASKTISRKKHLGVLVGGGPAPGINSTISAVVIKAINSGMDVTGIYDGFEHLMRGGKDAVTPLTIGDVSRIHFRGGSILRTSRANPTKRREDLQTTVKTLKDLGISKLVTIGGDDTAFAALETARAAKGAVRVAHVPKTIDNDLPLPGGMPTFGFESARHVGTDLVLNMMEDSRTTGRWFFVVVMGRKAGHLALGIGKAAGATLTIVPEEFPEQRISLAQVCNILEGAILKRRVMGRQDGLAVIAEGIGEKLNPEELSGIPGAWVTYDPYGHVRLAEMPLASIIQREVQRRFAARNDALPAVSTTIGYELRCAPPIPFDIDYTRTLGNGAVRFLLSAPNDRRLRYGGMICLQGTDFRVIPFDDLRDGTTGRTRVRLVDIESEHYQVAREYMIRLNSGDLENPRILDRLADAAKMNPEGFIRKFATVFESPDAALRRKVVPNKLPRTEVC